MTMQKLSLHRSRFYPILGERDIENMRMTIAAHWHVLLPETTPIRILQQWESMVQEDIKRIKAEQAKK